MPKKGYQQHERHRSAIKTAKLLKWLEAVTDTGLTPTGAEPTPAQLASVKMQLDRTMPVLSAVEQHVEQETSFVVKAPAELSAEAWQSQVDEIAQKKTGAEAPESETKH